MRTRSRTSPAPAVPTTALLAVLLTTALAGCAPPAPDEPTPPQPAAPQPAAPARHDAPPAGAGPVTAPQAAEIVTERYGGESTSIEPDEGDRGQPTWRVQLRASDRGDVEGQVDQNTGTLLRIEKD